MTARAIGRCPGGQAEVGEDLGDHGGMFDGGDDLQGAAGSTQTPKKTLAVTMEAKVREDAISRLVLGEVKPIALENALELYKRSKEGTPNCKNIVGYGNKLLGFKLQPKTGQRIEVAPLATADAYLPRNHE
jgi:hypothetical protein